MSFGDSRNAWRWGDQNGRNETGGTRSSRAFSGSARLDVLQCSASIAQEGEVTGLTFLQEFMFSSERAPHVLREAQVVAVLGRLVGQWQLELEPWRQPYGYVMRGRFASASGPTGKVALHSHVRTPCAFLAGVSKEHVVVSNPRAIPFFNPPNSENSIQVLPTLQPYPERSFVRVPSLDGRGKPPTKPLSKSGQDQFPAPSNCFTPCPKSPCCPRSALTASWPSFLAGTPSIFFCVVVW